MTTVVALSDTHLNSSQDRLDAWDKAITAGIDAGVTLWLHGGDVFHEESSIRDRLDAGDRIRRMAEVAPVIVCKGNHDRDGDLDIFRWLDEVWVIDRPMSIAAGSGRGAAAVFVLPYPSKAMLVGSGVPHEEIGTVADQALDALFLNASAELSSSLLARHPALMLGHATVAGAVSSAGQPMVGPEISVKATHLARLGPDVPKLFGHIHKPQEIYGAHYIGSLCRLDYGETEEKRILILRLVDGAWQQESVPIATPPRYHVEATLDLADGLRWQVTKGPGGTQETAPPSWAGCYVRVRVRHPEAERDVLGNVRQVAAAPFAGALDVQVEPVADQRREVRAPEVVAATSLQEKLQAWARVSGVSWSGELEEKAAQLAAEDAALAGIQDRERARAAEVTA